MPLGVPMKPKAPKGIKGVKPGEKMPARKRPGSLPGRVPWPFPNPQRTTPKRPLRKTVRKVK